MTKGKVLTATETSRLNARARLSYADRYSSVCDIIERRFFPNSYVPGFMNTSSEARAAAMEILEVLGL